MFDHRDDTARESGRRARRWRDPQATPFIIGEAGSKDLLVGDLAPDFDHRAPPDGSTYQLHDVDGNPVSLGDLRGKAVWINFFASWCPPCQRRDAGSP